MVQITLIYRIRNVNVDLPTSLQVLLRSRVCDLPSKEIIIIRIENSCVKNSMQDIIKIEIIANPSIQEEIRLLNLPLLISSIRELLTRDPSKDSLIALIQKVLMSKRVKLRLIILLNLEQIMMLRDLITSLLTRRSNSNLMLRRVLMELGRE